jgi:hypothetical protein
MACPTGIMARGQSGYSQGQRYPNRMNSPEEITPEQAERLVSLLGMMSDLSREGLGFLVGHMASRNVDLAIEAYGALMATELPVGNL